MSVLENFKNIPRSPYGGRQGSNVIFFLQICNEVPGEKKRGGGPVAPPNGRQAPVAHPRGDRPVGPAYRCRGGGGLPSRERQGGLSAPPPAADRGLPPYKSPIPPLPSSFEPENSTKNPEKKERSEEKESGEALPDSALVIYR